MQNQYLKQSYKSLDFHPLEAQQSNFRMLGSVDMTNQMMHVINAQNALIVRLIKHQNVLYQELNQKKRSFEYGSGSNDQQNIIISGYKNINVPEILNSACNQSIGTNQSKKHVQIIQLQKRTISHPSLKKVDFKYQINSSPQQLHSKIIKQEQNVYKRKKNQSKNMIKNFAKAIFRYIWKNKEKRQRVLHFLDINQKQFMQVFHRFKGHIHSITELRSLWSVDGNPFHKAFRIFSSEYLRKHCLEKTFNSRIENYSIHLKYRKRLLEALENPLDFSALKVD